MTFWTEERKESAKRLAAAGWSASRIADELGAVSRNAVIGVLNRDGIVRLKPRRSHAAAESQPPRQRRPKEAAPKAPKPMPAVVPLFPARELVLAPLVQPVSRNVALLDLKAGDCRYLGGDPRDPAAGFCGHPRQPGSSYCAWHHRLCYQPRRLLEAAE